MTTGTKTNKSNHQGWVGSSPLSDLPASASQPPIGPTAVPPSPKRIPAPAAYPKYADQPPEITRTTVITKSVASAATPIQNAQPAGMRSSPIARQRNEAANIQGAIC